MAPSTCADSPFNESPTYVQHKCVVCGHRYRLRSSLPQSNVCLGCMGKQSTKQVNRTQKVFFVVKIIASVLLILYGIYRLATKRNNNMLDFLEGTSALVGGAVIGDRALRSRRR